MAISERRKNWLRRKRRTRKQLSRTERTILSVYRSSKHIYAQLVDPLSGKTLTSVSTRTPAVRANLENSQDIEAAKKVGTAIAKIALDKKIEKVSFNRNGFVFTGRVQALADAAREAGLKF